MFILCICSRVKLDGSLGVAISLFILGACSLFDPIISLQSRGDNQRVMEPMKQLMNASVTKQIWLVVWNIFLHFLFFRILGKGVGLSSPRCSSRVLAIALVGALRPAGCCGHWATSRLHWNTLPVVISAAVCSAFDYIDIVD